jgi:predicted Zn-dependent protease
MSRISVLLLSLSLAACSALPSPTPQSPSGQAEGAARALYERGRELAAQGDSVRAEQYLAAALREGHDWEQALPPLLRVCLTGSRLRAALNYASPYLRAHPDATWLRYLVATVYLGLGQPVHAREHLLAIEGQPPYEARTQYLLGQTEWEGFGNAVAATRHFREYLRVEPNGPNAREVSEWLNAHAAEAAPRAALTPPLPETVQAASHPTGSASDPAPVSVPAEPAP